MLRSEEFNRFPDSVINEPVEVRLAKAKDLKSSPKLLEVLSRDDFWYVRDYVAANVNTPKHCLETLKNDCDFRVRAEAQKTLSLQEGLDYKILAAENVTPDNTKSKTRNAQIDYTRQ